MRRKAKARPNWTRNIRVWFRKGRQSDRRWYDETREWCGNVGAERAVRQPVELVAAVFSALSPGTSFERNKLETRALLKNTPVMFTTYPANVIKAEGIVERFKRDGDTAALAGMVAPHWPKSGNKIGAFYDNIVSPGFSRAVTVDRHAVAVCIGRHPEKSELQLGAALYRDYSRAYEIVADGLALLPHEVQAVTWSAWRRTEGDLHATEFLPF